MEREAKGIRSFEKIHPLPIYVISLPDFAAIRRKIFSLVGHKNTCLAGSSLMVAREFSQIS